MIKRMHYFFPCSCCRCKNSFALFILLYWEKRLELIVTILLIVFLSQTDLAAFGLYLFSVENFITNTYGELPVNYFLCLIIFN